MRIALDAMGGDHAPAPNVEGAIAAVAENPDLQVVLVGDRAQIEGLLDDAGYSGKQIEIAASEGVAGMDEKPTEALRKKPNCSIAVCWKLMAERDVDAVRILTLNRPERARARARRAARGCRRRGRRRRRRPRGCRRSRRARRAAPRRRPRGGGSARRRGARRGD